MSEARKGMLLVISGASGTGKGTVIKELMAHDDSLVFSVSATTRSPRPGEENGREYYFISEEEFARRVENDEFIEYAPPTFFHLQRNGFPKRLPKKCNWKGHCLCR